MAQKIVAGNWKMNLELDGAIELVHNILDDDKPEDVRIVLFPPSLFLYPIAMLNDGSFDLGAQNFYVKDSGAFTGEISPTQIKSAGGSIALIGHSERRAYFAESNEFLKEKVDQALANELQFIFCCGEPLMIREAGNEFEFVKMQLMESLFHLSADQIRGGIIAYEPVWAIGTGKTATTEQAEDMHARIRSWLTEKYSADVANSISLLYGGSCNPGNAKELFACKNVDGGLIGGASLNAEDFNAIIDSY